MLKSDFVKDNSYYIHSKEMCTYYHHVIVIYCSYVFNLRIIIEANEMKRQKFKNTLNLNLYDNNKSWFFKLRTMPSFYKWI